MTDRSESSSHLLSTKTFATLIAILAVILALFTPLRSFLPKLPSSRPLRTMSTTTTQSLKITKRPWNARGLADHGWLYSFHTFSFASYYAPQHESFGPLRVINEDRVAPSTGFGTHGHAEFLIWSYVVKGTLEHKDSLGTVEYLKPGEVQLTTAGTGVKHSEYNRDNKDEVHFLQIWAKPNIRGMKPTYETKRFADEMKKDKLVRIMEYTERLGEKTASSPIGLQANLSMDASILSPGNKVTHDIVADGPRKVYLHMVMGGRTQPKEGGAQIRIGNFVLGEGDGAYVEGATGPGKIEVESVGKQPAHFILFDMGVDES